MSGMIGICIPTIEGGVVCHQEIGREASRRGIDCPEIVTHTLPYSSIRKAVEEDDLSGLAETLLHSVGVLARSGAGFAIIPSNTMHLVFDSLRARSALPLLNIAEVTAQLCSDKGFRRVGVLGTVPTMRRRLFDPYLAAAGIRPVYPSAPDMETLSSVIATELIRGIFKEESIERLLTIGAGLAKEVDALILGCTELPLVMTKDNCNVPLVDTTRLLAHAALNHAMRLPATLASRRVG